MEPDITPDIRKRIIAAADLLFAQAGDGSIPNVDAVRRTAKANMNDVSAVMKQWRRTHLAKAASIPLLIPDPVQQACQTSLEHLWRTAQECADQHLRTAQAGWDQERAENDTLCQQLSKAFDEQALASTGQQRQLQGLGDELQAMTEQREAAEHALAISDAHRTATMARGQEQRAADMKEQLALANEALVHAHENLEKAHQRSEATAEALRADLRAAATRGADAARALAIAQAQSAILTETVNTTREQLSGLELRAGKTEALAAETQRQASTLEQRSAKTEALAAEAQRQVAALSEELIRVRSDVEQGRQTVRAAQSAAAPSQGERDAMAANLAQLLAAFKSGELATLPAATPKGRPAVK